MLIPFRKYRIGYTLSFGLSIFILCTLLMAGFLNKTGYSQFELTFAMTAIIGGVTYASMRDAAGGLAYAAESSKFYRDNFYFERLVSYAYGWRSLMTLLARPLPASVLMAVIFLGLESLERALRLPEDHPSLLATSILTIIFFPAALSSLIYFQSPVLVGWKEVRARKILASQAKDVTVRHRIRKITTEDLFITMLINIALVLPVRHNPEFHPSLGYGSTEFISAALILSIVVVSFSLLSSWRSRIYACSGELYIAKQAGAEDPVSMACSENRWKQWLRYSLSVCLFTMGTCLLMGWMYPSAPIEMVLPIILIPVAYIFWIERNSVLTLNFSEASDLVSQHPLRTPLLFSNEPEKLQ
jgi:hypothetical protein